MDSQKSFILVCSLLLISAPVVGGGPISWASCMAVVGVGGLVVGAAILPLLGFNGIAAGLWAGNLFAILQSTGAAGVSWSSYGGISGFCAALTAPIP